MPSQKGKGCPASHRYRPASEYDDATLAQKREYWRNKKREQRARLSERRKKTTLDTNEKNLSYVYVSAGVNANLSDPLAALPSPLLSNDVSYNSLSKTENTFERSSTKDSKKQGWNQSVVVGKVLRNLQPTSCSVLATAAEGVSVTVKRPTNKSLNAATSSKSSGTKCNTSSSVSPVRVTHITSSSSTTKTEAKPCGSGQRSSVSKTQSKAQVAFSAPRALCADVTTDIMHAASCGSICSGTEGQIKNTRPQSGTMGALVTTIRATGVGDIKPAPMESEEERAAKRREHWRIKKREQRAKLAIKIANVRERQQNREGIRAQKTRLVANSALLTSQPFLRGSGKKQTPVRVKVQCTTARLETNSMQSRFATSTLQTHQTKVQKPHGHTMEEKVVTTFDRTSVKTPAESQRKLTSVHHTNINRGTSACTTFRQRSFETQKNLLNQRNLRSKTLLTATGLSNRGLPKLDPNDSPEQTIAKQREYWRNKKREQRAKLSLEKKIRLKEKDSFTRRVKRYQQILEEMRRARALAHSTERTPILASEAIGGFIKEDGTVTINIPQSQICQNTADEKLYVNSKSTVMQKPSQTDLNCRRVGPSRVNQRSPPTLSSQDKAVFSLAVQTVRKTSKVLTVKSQPDLDISSVSSKPSKGVEQLTLARLQSPQNAASVRGSKSGGCVMKMCISSHRPTLSVLSVGPKLTEEERMAKKREYWRIKKREQRAARAARLKHSIFQARTSGALLRRRVQVQVSSNTMQLSTKSVSSLPRANEIKQERDSVPAADLHSLPDGAICPDIKPTTSPPPVSPPEPESSLHADAQATTLLAVASMKKLLEESLSTVSDIQVEQAVLAIDTSKDTSVEDKKPNLSQLICEKNDEPLVADLLTPKIESFQTHSDVLEGKDLPNPQSKDLFQITEAVPSLSPSSEVVHSTCDQPSQTYSTTFINTASSCETQRQFSNNWAHQNRCSDEPPKLHHITNTVLDPPQLRQLDQQSRCRNIYTPSAERYRSSMSRKNSLCSIQKKREYWKLMKRQQRARLRARQKELSKNIQTTGPTNNNDVKCVNVTKPALPPSSSVASVGAARSIPEDLVDTCKAECSPDARQVKLPVSESEGNVIDEPSSDLSDFHCVSSHHSQKWKPRTTETDAAASLPTLNPPDNPLSSIDLQPIEFPDKHQNPILTPIKIPCGKLPSPINICQPSSPVATLCALMPPKRTPGESEESFLKRKREYWRLKKKEQRARKAFQDGRSTSSRASHSGADITSAQDLQTLMRAVQDSSLWVNSCETPENQMSIPVDPDASSFMYPDRPAQVEGEADFFFAHHDHNEEEDSIPEAAWRSRYLMDYDPLNQLLVCMVCGELQYSHSLEGVRAHIDEAHPHTLRLEPGEKLRILQAWDEQVSQRERFFSSQLQQQHCGSAEETYRN